MRISTTIRPQHQSRPAASKPAEEQKPKEPWHQQAADYLDQSNDILTPKLAALGAGAMGAMKGNQITESLHPVAKVIGIVGGGLLGAVVGHTGGSLVHSASSFATDKLFGEDNSLAKTALSVGINSAAFGVAGGWTGAALYGAFTVGGAAELARRDMIQEG